MQTNPNPQHGAGTSAEHDDVVVLDWDYDRASASSGGSRDASYLASRSAWLREPFAEYDAHGERDRAAAAGMWAARVWQVARLRASPGFVRIAHPWVGSVFVTADDTWADLMAVVRIRVPTPRLRAGARLHAQTWERGAGGHPEQLSGWQPRRTLLVAHAELSFPVAHAVATEHASRELAADHALAAAVLGELADQVNERARPVLERLEAPWGSGS